MLFGIKSFLKPSMVLTFTFLITGDGLLINKSLKISIGAEIYGPNRIETNRTLFWQLPEIVLHISDDKRSGFSKINKDLSLE